MGFRVVPYEPWHLRSISLQPAQSGMTGPVTETDLPERVPQCGPCWTALVDGRPIACAGFTERDGKTWGWAALSPEAGKHMVALTRAVRKAIKGPVHMTVEAGFTEGVRWARLLGFREAGVLPGYYEGRDHVEFAR